MREIIFRGKRVDNGEWVEGFYSQFHNRPVVPEPNSHQIFELLEDEHAIMFCGTAIGGLWRIIDENTLRQFTGICDKNGKKIFEGDIVRDIENGIYEISYDEKNIAFALKQKCGEYDIYWNLKSFDNINDFEVIGNIHDNPELLENKE